MSHKTTRVICNFEPDAPVTLALSPLAIEDLTDTSVYQFTPTGRAEIVAAESIPMTTLLKLRIEEFRAARLAREKAGRKELLAALQAEEKAALLLAWTIENIEPLDVVAALSRRGIDTAWMDKI